MPIAADHLKLVFPFCWALTQIAWTMHSAREALEASFFQGKSNFYWAICTLKHGLAFLSSCQLSDEELVAQVCACRHEGALFCILDGRSRTLDSQSDHGLLHDVSHHALAARSLLLAITCSADEQCVLPCCHRIVACLQIGEFDADHRSCYRAERDHFTPRTVYTITPSRPGADLASAAATAFAASSVALRPTDPQLAADALARARKAYAFALKHPGCYSKSLGQCKQSYDSENWHQYAFFAAAWLLQATDEVCFKEDAERFYREAENRSYWPNYSWAAVYFGACVLLLSKTGHERYLKKIRYFADSHLNCKHGVSRTPCGLDFINKWGSLRHAAAAAGLMAVYAKVIANSHPDEAAAAKAFAESQVRYFCEGAGHSWIVGFGKNYPVRPHHRDAALRMDQSGSWSVFNSNAPSPNLLAGALVGGPDQDGTWKDDRKDYVGNEVALDYNAALLFAVANVL